ncbi:MAG: helix-turn-helix transcriptional regulator [Gemmatimonadaceae bacterium]
MTATAQPPAIETTAGSLARQHLRPDVAKAVDLFLAHAPHDLNVSRVAVALGISRWTLQRRMRAESGCSANHILTLALLCLAMARLLRRNDEGIMRSTRNGHALTRSERRAVQGTLGLQPAELSKVVQQDGARGVEWLLRTRLCSTLPLPPAEEAPVG